MMKKFFAFALFFVSLSSSAQAGFVSEKQLLEQRKAVADAKLQREKDQLKVSEETAKQQQENNKLMQELLNQNKNLNSKFDTLIDSNNEQNDLLLELLRRTE